MNQPTTASCRNVFRDGNITKEKYTKLWAVLLNQMERSKQVLTGAQ